MSRAHETGKSEAAHRYTSEDVDDAQANVLAGPVRVIALLTPAGFAVLAATLVAVDAVAWPDAAWASAAICLALVPSAWLSANSNRRRAAEALVVPAAFVLTMIAGAAMRRMLLPPLLIAVAWAAHAAARGTVSAQRRPVLAACLGLSVRAATGLGLAGHGWLGIVLAILVAAAVPWAIARRFGPRPAELAALAAAALPWQRWPAAAAGLLLLAAILGAARSQRDAGRAALGWLPGWGGAALLASTVAAWPGLGSAQLLPVRGWWVGVVLIAVLAASTRLRPGAAGALWFGAALVLAPALAPTPEHRAFDLSSELGEWTAPPGAGGPYIIDLEVRQLEEASAGLPVALVDIAGEVRALTADGTPAEAIWRPYGRGGARSSWRGAVRHRFSVPPGVRPVVSRNLELPEDVTVRIVSVGPVRPTPPRSWALAAWMLAAAAAVALLQVLSGAWRSAGAAVPWLVLVVGALVARTPVEPLHLAGERFAPDLALAALLAAWWPAARLWLARGRVALATAAILVPIALATPQLTPPLYGDEPFHLVLMESAAADHDLDIADNLDLENHPQNSLYAPGRPFFHSPALGLLLLPGYLAAGRSGALLLLALMGAVLATLLARRARDLGLGEAKVALLVMALAVTYPLATFSSQIWPEVPGALAVAALLVIAARPRGGGPSAVVVAVSAALVKTRLALLAFPLAAASLLRRRRALGLIVLAAAGAAVAVVGWLVMGHPFGPYRRLHHLVPSDPTLAVRVVAGLVFDAAGGLMFTAPLLLVAAAGAAALWRRGGVGERAALLGFFLTLAALLHSSEWYGGGAPPARYLVSALPVFFLAGAMVLAEPRHWRRLAVIVVPPSFAAWWVLVTRPHHSVNPGDGGYWLADALARRFAADATDFFPSYLVPNAASVAVPLLVVGGIGVAAWAAARRPIVGAVLRRAWVALWLVASAGLVAALESVPDRVVELEAPQVRRSGGSPVPEEGAVARYSHRRGWRLEHGDRVVVPVRFGGGRTPVLEGWLLGTARARCDFTLRWDEGPDSVISWRGGAEPPERVELPPPPEEGRHRLAISFACPPGGAVVLDRLTLQAAPEVGGGP